MGIWVESGSSGYGSNSPGGSSGTAAWGRDSMARGVEVVKEHPQLAEKPSGYFAGGRG